MCSFGIVIACCKSDVHYARACLQSIRYFLGDVPVCFFVDGKASLLDAVRNDENVRIMPISSLNDQWLRSNCVGWGHPKMAALWEAPFEKFLYLDADTIVWGDVLSAVSLEGYDFVVDQQRVYEDDEIGKWFFNIEKVRKFYPDFDYAAFRDRYACSGTFFASRKRMDLAAYQEAYALQKNNDALFFPGEMGIWNLLLFYGAQKGTLNIGSVRFQVIPMDHSEDEMRNEYSPSVLGRGNALRPAVLHFCGKKAHIFSSSSRVAAMNYFRMQYLQLHDGHSVCQAVFRMAIEDIYFVFWPKVKRGCAKLSRIIRSVFRGAKSRAEA